MSDKQIRNFMRHWACDEATARNYHRLLDDGHYAWRAMLMVGLTTQTH